MATYKPLQSIVLTTATASVTFSGIDQNYTDLVLVVSNVTNASGTNSVFLRFNGDSTTNYSATFLEGNGTSATSSRLANRTVIDSGYNVGLSTSNPGQVIFNIFNYSNTTTYKTVLSRFAQTSGAAPGTSATASLWRATPAAITSIEVRCDVNLLAGTTFDLYGIKSGAPQALGGNLVITDGNYWYNVFTSSGTFTTFKSLTCDVLSVGGGGGGGWNNAGGGGGGEVDILTGLSIASGVTKTVTIGGGGAPATSVSGAGVNGGTTSFASDTSSLGGGGGGTGDATGGKQSGQTGGSGGGGALSSGGGSASGSNTNAGGAGYAVGGGQGYAGGGGGGATAAGGNASSGTRTSGAGGQGYALSNIFSGLTISGLTHFGSGGSGGVWGESNTAFLGTAATNGGTGAREATNGNISPVNATTNGGGGGGGGAYTGVNSRAGSNGGSGIVIVRYPV